MHRIKQTLYFARTGGLIASRAFKRSSPHELMLICNGCGAANSKFDFVPDSIWDHYIGYACIIHDHDYHLGKTAKDKKVADKTFRKNLMTIISWDESWWKPRLLMRSRALGYYYGVKVFGDSAYWQGKKRN